MNDFTDLRLSETKYYQKPKTSENSDDFKKDPLAGNLGYCHFDHEGEKDFVGRLHSYRFNEGVLELKAITFRGKEALLRIYFAKDNVFRLMMFPYGDTTVRLNPVFEFTPIKEATLEEDPIFLNFKSRRVTLMIRKCPYELNVYLDGKELTKEQIKDFDCGQKYKSIPLGFTSKNGKVLDCFETMYSYSDEAYYGFGEKFTTFNKRGQKITVWQHDSQSTNSDVSYKSMPYFMSSNGYSILLNSFTRTHFNMGATSYVSYNMEVEDPYIDYYMFCNKDYMGLLEDYTSLTGRSPLIPKWAFGFWMSKMSYMSRDELEGVVSKMEKFGMSVDVIHIDAWGSNGFDGNPDLLSFDEKRFPHPEEMIANLKKRGIKLSLWMFPYVIYTGPFGKKAGYPSAQYEYCKKHGYLVKSVHGGLAFLKGGLVPAPGGGIAFFDFTNPEAVNYMKARVKRLMHMGVGVIKTDFSEDIPEDAIFYDGTKGIEGHNKYPLLYAKTIYEASKEAKEEMGEKALLWGRSGYSGSQNFPANWAGDSSAATNNLAAILNGGLSMGISGISFWGFDIGGFYNCDYEGVRSIPSTEDYVRSVQMGLMAPLSRSHGQSTPREPWNYSEEAQEAFLKINKIRYRLLPYIYSTSYLTHLYGIPMMRAMLLEFPDEILLRDISTQYMYGDSLLVAPTFDQLEQRVYLPKGSWVDYYTGERIPGGQAIVTDKDLMKIPMYIRKNTALVMLEEAPLHIENRVFTGLELTMNLTSSLKQDYYDDGIKTTIEATYENGTINISYSQIDVRKIVIYAPKETKKVLANGKETPFVTEGHKAIVDTLGK